jgi:S-formylglutathione hydrolase FrmB
MHRHHGKPAYVSQFDDDAFQFGLEIALGACQRGAADAGEVLVTAARIKDGDADAWVREWTATADAVEAAGRAAAAAGHPVSALAYLRRAATYLATALDQIDSSHEHDGKRALWRRQRASWEQVVDLSGGERVAIPYDGSTMPGFFFRAPGAAPGEPRPLVVLNNGSDGATSQMWVQGGAAASERGHHWMTFDGPGQQALLFEHGVPFRPDWEAVLTPVLDAMVARPDVDADRIAVIGISQGGFWVPRALAFEHRFAAAVADPGVVDVSTSWVEPLPKSLRKELADGKQEQFDRNMRIGERFSRGATALLTFRGEPYGLHDDSRFRLYEAVMQYRLGDEVAEIDTPLLITEPEGEQFWPGQSQELFDRVPGEKELVRFTAAEGAGRHCEPMAPALRDARVFDWLDRYLARPS